MKKALAIAAAPGPSWPSLPFHRVDDPITSTCSTTIVIYSILLLGLDIVVGYTGQVSLGHAGLFGIGAYTAGVLVMTSCGGASLIRWTSSSPLGIGGHGAFGALLALPALRVTGPYLAMVTLAFGTIIGILINEMAVLTNGPLGHQADTGRYCLDSAPVRRVLPVLQNEREAPEGDPVLLRWP